MKEKILLGTMWLMSAKVIVNLLAILSTIVLARLLSPEDFGIVAIMIAIYSVFEAVTNLSSESALIHINAPTEEHFHTVWTLNFTRATVLALVFFCIADTVAFHYNDSRLIQLIHVFSISIFITGLNNPKLALFKKNLVFWQEFAVSVSTKLTSLIVSIFLAIIYKNYWAILGGIVASEVVKIMLSFFLISYKPRFSFKYINEIWTFSVWLTLGRALSTITSKIDLLLLGSFLGARDVGTYTVGDNIATLPTKELTHPLTNALFPGYSKLASDKFRLAQAYTRSQTLITAAVLPVSFCLAIISADLVPLLMGEKWLQIIDIIQVIACFFAFFSLGNQAPALAMAVGKTKRLFYIDVTNMIIKLPIVTLGLYFNGLMGLVFGRVIYGSIALIITMILIRNITGLSVLKQFIQNWRSIFAVVLMSGLSVILDSVWYDIDTVYDTIFKIIIMIIFCFSSYIVITYSLWCIGNKPQGPEMEVITLIKKVFLKKLTLKR